MLIHPRLCGVAGFRDDRVRDQFQGEPDECRQQDHFVKKAKDRNEIRNEVYWAEGICRNENGESN